MKKNCLRIIICILVCISKLTLSFSFTNLDDLNRYAKAFPEEVTMDNEDLLNPDYKTFYLSITPGRFSRFAHRIGILKTITWNSYQFKKLLEEVTKDRETREFSGNTVAHIRCTPETSLYVWSDVHSAFHSLVRCLLFLQEQKVIDNSLKIIQPNTYFIFNGDYIDYSAYNLESLHVMLLLLKQNPDTVFYIRGKHESQQYWHNFTLKADLQIRATHLSNESIPLDHLITSFFDTLPYAAYFSLQGNSSQVIRISPFGRDDPRFDERNMSNLFTKNSDTTITYYNLDTEKESTNPVDVKVIIKSTDWLRDQRITSGLELLEQDQGSTAWSMLSTPIKLNQVYFNLFNDSFIVIKLGKSIDESIITLYQNNIQTNDGFKKIKTYNMVTGIAEGTPAYKQERKSDIIIGSTMSLGLGIPTIGLGTKRGMLVCINEINKLGGVNGHHIRAIIRNDDYIPYVARENVTNFIEQGITTILLPVGSPTLEAYTDLIEEKKALILFPVTGAPQFHSPKLLSIVHWRASYADEVKALIDYILAEYGIQRMAFFYQDDAYGQGAYQKAQEVLKSKGITTWLDVPYTRGSTNFKEEVNKIKTDQPEAIGLFSIPQATQEFITTYGIPGLTNIQLFGISPIAELSLKAFIKSFGIRILFGCVVPNPYINQLEIVREYRIAMDSNHYLYDTFSLEAYITTSLFLAMLKQIDEPITMDKILTKFESLKNYPYKGLTLTFNPQERDLSQPVWIETNDETEWIEQATTS